MKMDVGKMDEMLGLGKMDHEMLRGSQACPPFWVQIWKYLDYLKKTLGTVPLPEKFKNVKNWVRKTERGKLGQWLYTKQFFEIYTNVTKRPSEWPTLRLNPRLIWGGKNPAPTLGWETVVGRLAQPEP